ncbi:MAG: DNA-binding transcriptional regulator [Sedimentisphaerales bacterium]|nr:DNA-binding transcriptional regulator [Sedimentisphaerales bacterium]
MKEKIKIAFAHNQITHNTEGLLAGVSQYIRDKGDWQLIIWPDSSQKSLQFLKERGCKGAFVSVQTTTKAKELLRIGIPVIGVATIQNLLNLPFVSANSRQVAQMACEYLLKKKFENFAFFGITQARWSAERLEYFSRYLAEKGKNVQAFREKQVLVANDEPATFTRLWIKTALKTGQQKLVEWLNGLPKPVAILASCDTFACHLINVASEAGLNIPDEIAILGVNNDIAICNICDPPLSSIAFNFKKAGYNAAKLLDKMITGQETMQGQCIEIRPTHVETRGSTDVYAVEDPDIAQAMKYIRQNAHTPLQVDAIARHVYTSKRALQLKFHKVVGKSIHEEIVQAHFELAKALLIETNLPVDEIAVRSGFHYPSNMRRAFKEITGMLPHGYRQQQRPQ